MMGDCPLWTVPRSLLTRVQELKNSRIQEFGEPGAAFPGLQRKGAEETESLFFDSICWPLFLASPRLGAFALNSYILEYLSSVIPDRCYFSCCPGLRDGWPCPCPRPGSCKPGCRCPGAIPGCSCPGRPWPLPPPDPGRRLPRVS